MRQSRPPPHAPRAQAFASPVASSRDPCAARAGNARGCCAIPSIATAVRSWRESRCFQSHSPRRVARRHAELAPRPCPLGHHPGTTPLRCRGSFARSSRTASPYPRSAEEPSPSSRHGHRSGVHTPSGEGADCTEHATMPYARARRSISRFLWRYTPGLLCEQRASRAAATMPTRMPA